MVSVATTAGPPVALGNNALVTRLSNRLTNLRRKGLSIDELKRVARTKRLTNMLVNRYCTIKREFELQAGKVQEDLNEVKTLIAKEQRKLGGIDGPKAYIGNIKEDYESQFLGDDEAPEPFDRARLIKLQNHHRSALREFERISNESREIDLRFMRTERMKAVREFQVFRRAR